MQLPLPLQYVRGQSPEYQAVPRYPSHLKNIMDKGKQQPPPSNSCYANGFDVVLTASTQRVNQL